MGSSHLLAVLLLLARGIADALPAAPADAKALAQIAARLGALEKENALLRERTARLEQRVVRANLTDGDAGELRIFNADACPEGWEEAAVTQGYLLLGRPVARKCGEKNSTLTPFAYLFEPMRTN